MQVTNTATTPAAQVAGSADTLNAAVGGGVDALANKETFLQLLVAQIKNQDPLKPTDGIQFVSQLAQFSELEQLIGIRGEIKDLTPVAASDTPAVNPAS